MTLTLIKGMTLEASDKGVNGCVVKTLNKNGDVFRDGRIHVGDYIMSFNNESMRRITNAQARAILRRAAALSDIRFVSKVFAL